ncbi:MAG: hypothetical protein ABR589_11425 [Chthoniobacterales bacterium]
MSRIVTQIAVALLLACVCGCTPTRPRMLAAARPATTPDRVRVYENAPRRFQEIAVVQSKTLAGLQAEAAAVGANGVLVRGVVERPGPLIGIGLGGSSVSVGRRSAVGIGTGVSFAAPLGRGQVLEGVAIYVP